MNDAPQEIIDHIVSFLEDDIDNLIVARRISYSWNLSCRVHLFKNLDLRIPEHLPERLFPSRDTTINTGTPVTHATPCISTTTVIKRFRNLLELLVSSPDVAPCARNIIMGNSGIMTQEANSVYEDLIPALLSKLRCVTSLQLSRMRWSDASPAMFDCLYIVLASPHLHHIDVWNCAFPNSDTFNHILSIPRSVHSIRIAQIYFTDSGAESPLPFTLADGNIRGSPYTSSRLPLRVLDIETTNLKPLLDALLASSETPENLRMDGIERLSIKYIRDEFSVRAFLKTFGGTVEHLELKASASWDSAHNPSPLRPIELESLPSLRSLRILGVQWVGQMSSAHRIASIFIVPQNSQSQRWQRPTALEHVHVSITVLPMRHSLGYYEQWLALDEVLTSPAYATLQSVTVHVYLHQAWEKMFNQVKFKEQFPALSRQQKISYEFLRPLGV